MTQLLSSVKPRIRNHRPTAQTSEFHSSSSPTSKAESFTLVLAVPSPQPHPIVKISLFALNHSEQIRSGALTAVISVPPASCTSGLWGETSIALALLYFSVIYLDFCVGKKTPTFKCLIRQPGEQDCAACSLPLQDTQLAAILPASLVQACCFQPFQLPSAAKVSFCPLIFVYFGHNLMLIRFQIPQIRECEANADSHRVQRGLYL